MPKLTIDGGGAFDIPAGKRLINALIEDAGVDQLHACGGNGRCTTCRVVFVAGEPSRKTQVEAQLIRERGLLPSVRLSCQILCDQDMTVKVISRLAGSGRANAGDKPDSQIQPPPVWSQE